MIALSAKYIIRFIETHYLKCNSPCSFLIIFSIILNSNFIGMLMKKLGTYNVGCTHFSTFKRLQIFL